MTSGLVGMVTIDDVVDVIREETEEDMARMAGLGDEEITRYDLHHGQGAIYLAVCQSAHGDPCLGGDLVV